MQHMEDNMEKSHQLGEEQKLVGDLLRFIDILKELLVGSDTIREHKEFFEKCEYSILIACGYITRAANNGNYNTPHP